MPRTALLLSLLALLPALAARAGTVMESISTENGEQVLRVQGGQVRIDPARRGAPAMLFDAGRQRLVLLNRPARQYNVIDADRLAILEERVAGQRADLRRRMGEATPDERESLRKRLERLPRIDGPGAIRIETGAGSERINDLACTPGRAWSGDRPTHRLCLTRVAELGLPATTTHTLRSLFEFLARLRNLLGGGSAPFDARLLQAALRDADALPVRIERIEDGSRWTVRRIEQRAIPADRFDIPADYTEGARLGTG